MSKINTIIVPIIHGGYIGRFLETLWSYTEPNFYVFVIDQCADDEAYNKYHKNTHLWIKSYRNLGFSKAHNTGIKLAQTPYISLYNDDIEFIDKRWWQGILDTFTQDEKIIAVNPMSPKEGGFGYGLTTENKETWVPKKGFLRDGEFVVPELPDGSGLYYKEEFTSKDYDFLLNDHPCWKKDTVCDAICMWGTTFTRKGLDTIGMLDERFYPGNGEDYDMNGRAYSCAWPTARDECDPTYHRRMVSTTKSWVWHHWGQSKNFLTSPNSASLSLSRDSWNNIGDLWPGGFDVWSHKTVNDKKIPYKRVPDIFEDDL